MAKSYRKQRRFAVERLEGRALLAGDVGVTFSGGELNIQGDAQDNALEVVQAVNGTVTVRGLPDANGIPTTINGLPLARFPLAVVSKSQIALQDGADSVTIRNLSVGSDLKIDTGGGDDVVRGTGVRVGVVVGSSAEILTGVGNDSVTLSNASVVGDLVVDTGEGADTVIVNSGSTISKTAKAVTGAGNDTVRFTNTAVGTLEAETDIGNDVVALSFVTALEGINVQTGEGLDRITVRDSSASADLNIVSGSGNDVVTAERVSSGASVHVLTEDGNDQVTARQITAAIDIVLEGGADVDTLISEALLFGNSLIVTDFEL